MLKRLAKPLATLTLVCLATNAGAKAAEQASLNTLQEKADENRHFRYVCGGLAGGLGLGALIVGSSMGGSDPDRVTGGLTMIGGGVLLGAGILIVAITTSAEDAYEKAKTERRASNWHLNWTPTPETPLAANLSLNF